MNRDDLITPSEGNKSGDGRKNAHMHVGIGQVQVRIPMTKNLKQRDLNNDR